AAHTLKGLCATMQYETMSTIAMFMEEYLRLLEPKLDQLEGKRPFEPLATAARVFKNLLNDVVTGEQPSLTSLEFLDELARV
ncbi:MAG: Hpt domain-containing protein, partial [Anaerolineae bacterium]